ncbi:MAG TPA: VOC family protein [Acidimicrobiales bacterium]|jgi:predicted enzyme related to lactoylglutathione lyase|nr:VOC family protein [Acidimicrobiales bacterium]
MNEGIKTLVVPVKDIAQAKALYSTLLGVEPYTDEAWYVGFRLGGLEVGLDPNGHRQGMTGPVAYSYVDDIEKTVQSLVEAGAVTNQAATDVGGGMLRALVTDADGNVIGLIQPPQ